MDLSLSLEELYAVIGELEMTRRKLIAENMKLLEAQKKEELTVVKPNGPVPRVEH